MIQWEYHKEVSAVINVQKMNELGAQGWEHYLSTGNIHLFKRQIDIEQKEKKRANKNS